ncbi:hypothetical protein EBN03_31410 [Nocardia stercoris]|uniref:Peptidase S1 domain-containing protein n=2 Tax=Nocardia stercoris TaxID=2483361 RepID=A0A3M2KSY3_9NOCA|nr:hypothetical protein EBN03_31410 [Nocardia stercoris]
MGGDPYTIAATGVCSFGFNGVDGSGNIVNITAGHCDESDAPLTLGAGTSDPAIGTFDVLGPDGVDFSTIKIDDAAAERFENNFVRGPGGKALAITGTADPVVGAPVCKSGWRAGYSCGTILAVNQTMDGGNGRMMKGEFVANHICSLPGDSGGPVVTGTRALGITSIGNKGSQAECDATSGPDINPWSQPYDSAVPIKTILEAVPGLKVRTN